VRMEAWRDDSAFEALRPLPNSLQPGPITMTAQPGRLTSIGLLMEGRRFAMREPKRSEARTVRSRSAPPTRRPSRIALLRDRCGLPHREPPPFHEKAD